MYIYLTTNLLNGKIYIGLSKFDSEENPDYLGSGCLILKAIQRYGSENFKKEILEICSSQEELCEKERYWIDKYKSNHRGVGYNICEGGTWGDNWTNNPNKKELREKFKELNGGEKNPNYGRKWTLEQKEALSLKRRKNPTLIDKTTGLNVAQLPETRKRLSEQKKGIKNPNACYWKLISPEGKELIINGGIKREIKKHGQDYQVFRPRGEDIRHNKKGWMLIKIRKEDFHGSHL